jgi:hypothetical protein
MLVFTAAGKGGAGQTVTGCNMAYQLALMGDDVAYLDFDFGRPSAGTVFEIEAAAQGLDRDGIRSFLLGNGPRPAELDVAAQTTATALRDRTHRAGRLVLLPGDRGAGWFGRTAEIVHRCSELFLRMESEFSVTVVDLGSGRTVAVDLALEVLARPQLQNVLTRWLVIHKWTRQHVAAAGDFVHGPGGLIETARLVGLDPARFQRAVRFVRSDVVDTTGIAQYGRASHLRWQAQTNAQLRKYAARHRLASEALLATVPFDPVLQLREQIITSADATVLQIANQDTLQAYVELAQRLNDQRFWEAL